MKLPHCSWESSGIKWKPASWSDQYISQQARPVPFTLNEYRWAILVRRPPSAVKAIWVGSRGAAKSMGLSVPTHSRRNSVFGHGMWPLWSKGTWACEWSWVALTRYSQAHFNAQHGFCINLQERLDLVLLWSSTCWEVSAWSRITYRPLAWSMHVGVLRAVYLLVHVGEALSFIYTFTPMC